MIQVETGCKTVFRFDNVIPSHVCDLITNFMIEIKGENKNSNLSVLPWYDNDSYNWKLIDNDYLYARIEAFREVVTYLVCSCYKEIVYPTHTDIVLWRKGRSMRRHRDDGYDGDSDPLRARAYTTVTYLNDNYKGGETFIKTENGDYISQPKKGTTIMMRSTPENVHGVTTITSGLRVTLPVWFTRDQTKMENYNPRY